jgi:hypothetical protein
MKRNKKLKNLKLRISGLEDCLIAQDNVIDSYQLHLEYEIRRLNDTIKSIRVQINSLTNEVSKLKGQSK